MPPLEMPNPSDVASDWVDGATGAGQSFASAASAASGRWFNAASSDQAQSNYDQQMSDPNVRQRRQDNITSETETRYADSINEFGAQHYEDGVRVSQNEFQSAWSEVSQAVEGTQLPERGTPNSQNNRQRALQTFDAFHDAGSQV